MIERKFVRVFLGEELNREFPLRERSCRDRLEHVPAVEVRVGAGNLDSLIPNGRLHAEFRTPVEFDEGGLAGAVDQPEAMDTKAFDHPQRTRYRAIRHDPHDHMHGFRRKRNEVPECVVRGCRLREAAIGFHLDGVDQVRKFDGILDEEDRDVVAYQVPVAFLGVELHGKAAYVTGGVDRAGATRDGRYPGKYGRPFTDLGENPGGRIPLQRGGQLEEPMRARRSRVNDTLRNALVIEMRDLLAKDEVLQERRAARVGPERVLIIGKRDALIRSERGVPLTGDLVQLAARRHPLISGGDGTPLLFPMARSTRRRSSFHDRPPYCSVVDTLMTLCRSPAAPRPRPRRASGVIPPRLRPLWPRHARCKRSDRGWVERPRRSPDLVGEDERMAFLLPSQCFDGVQLCRLSGRKIAEDDSCQKRAREGDDDRCNREDHAPACNRGGG